MEKRGTLVHCRWECKLVQPLWKMVGSLLKKLKIERPYDLAIPLLGIYPKKRKIPTWKGNSTPMFIVTSFTAAHRYADILSINEWMDEEDMVYIYNGILLSLKKRMESCRLQQHGWTWRYHAKWNKLNGERQILYVFYMWNLENKTSEYSKKETDLQIQTTNRWFHMLNLK